jgi:spore germination cell wall hydrolase CwlJ-like protein
MCLLLITALHCSAAVQLSEADVRAFGQETIACLAQTIYHEARNEPEEARIAVAHVVLTRTYSARFPDSVCGVVQQGAYEGRRPIRWRCQFTYYCDGKPDTPYEVTAWNAAAMLAADMLAGRRRVPAQIQGATHYHADYVLPRWALDMRQLGKLGKHYFYTQER